MPYEIHLANLPFKIVRACRCSFVVRFNSGKEAFISNDNLLAFMDNPCIRYEIVSCRDARGIETEWVAVHKCIVDLGFKTPIFHHGERL